MTIPYLTRQEFFETLKRHGWEEISSEFWNDYDRVLVGNGQHSFPLQVRPLYYYPIVVTTFTQLGIPVPAEHQTCYDQWAEQKKKQ